MLHLEFVTADCKRGEPHSAAGITEQRRLGLVCAEQISLAIANVKLRDQLRDQSIRDALTGMFNRRYMLETCRREFSRAARAGTPVGILSIDVDHFKKFNDNHGHDAGDTVLRAVGDLSEEQLPRRGRAVPVRRRGVRGAAARRDGGGGGAQGRGDPRQDRGAGGALRRRQPAAGHHLDRRRGLPGRGRQPAVGAEVRRRGALSGQGRRPQPRRDLGRCRCARLAHCSPGALAAARGGGESGA